MSSSAESSASGNSPQAVDPAVIDASCRWPVLTLFKGAAFWLVISSIFGLIASLRFHKPDLLADSAALSYGRAYAVWAVAMVYGFCIPTALGFILWILARLGRTPLRLPFLAAVGAKAWHLGVFFGLIGILRGATTGYEWFELPRYAALMLFGAFVLIAIPAFLTHADRTEPTLQPPQWFALAALFWLPWILSTAILLLQFFPVRGVAQAAIAWWYSGNLLTVWLGLAGLAAVFYLLPKLVQRPLQSRYNALFVFWTLIGFGTWTGIPGGVALPAWMPALSGAAAMMLLVTALAVAACVFQTTRSVPGPGSGVLCFAKSAGWLLALALVLIALTGIPQFSRITEFTWYGHSHVVLRLYGFFALTAFAAAYEILPRVTGMQISAGRIRLHYWLAMPGALLMSLPLVVGGIRQGLKLLDPQIEFLEASRAAMMAFRLTALGELLFLVGALLFCVTTLSLAFRVCRTVVKGAIADEPKLSNMEAHA